MIWLTWRQFRSQAMVIGAALVLVAVIVLVSGLSILHQYHSCEALHACDSSGFTNSDQKLQGVLQAVLLIAPALVGIFWGAPLVARELEAGTYRLGWTQSVTRRHWLAMKLAIVGLAAVAVGGLLSLMVSWWFSPIDTVTAQQFGTFAGRGIVPVGYAFFAFAVGVTAGVLWRRTLPAMACTLVAYVVARAAESEWLRSHLLPAVHRIVPVNASNVSFGVSGTPSGPVFMVGAPNIPNAWVYSASLVAKTGHEPSTTFIDKACSGLLKSLPSPGNASRAGILGGHSAVRAKSPAPATGPAGLQSCLDKVAAHYNQLVSYQPSYHYWPLQVIETALFVVIALALLGLSLWWVRHRVS
jgi:hypothetical protein